jgi:transposase
MGIYVTHEMNRLKALYRSWAIPCAGTQVYAPHYRSEWLSKIMEAGVRRRAELYYQQLDALRLVRQQARKELLAEARKHRATKLLRQIPGIGPLRAAHLVALMQTPHRFRTKRQLWTYSGLGLETHDSAQYRVVEGQLQRSKKPVTSHEHGPHLLQSKIRSAGPCRIELFRVSQFHRSGWPEFRPGGM